MATKKARIDKAMKVYTSPITRGVIVDWYVKEQDIDIETVELDFKAKDHKKEEYLKVNPFGQVPSLEDGDFKLTESGAIVQYLAMKHAGLKDPQEIATMSRWHLFAMATLWEAVTEASSAEEKLGGLFKAWNDSVTTDYVMGDKLTGADCVLMGSLNYVLGFKMQSMDLKPYPRLQAYMERCKARPAYKETMAKSMG